jgi:hypothetical protein
VVVVGGSVVVVVVVVVDVVVVEVVVDVVVAGLRAVVAGTAVSGNEVSANSALRAARERALEDSDSPRQDVVDMTRPPTSSTADPRRMRCARTEDLGNIGRER